jgi:hypothetical protein
MIQRRDFITLLGGVAATSNGSPARSASRLALTSLRLRGCIGSAFGTSCSGS